MGTSLKVTGIQQLVRNFAKVVTEQGGYVVLINDSYLGKNWDGVFTHWIRGKCDAATILLKSCMIELDEKAVTLAPVLDAESIFPSTVLQESPDSLCALDQADIRKPNFLTSAMNVFKFKASQPCNSISGSSFSTHSLPKKVQLKSGRFNPLVLKKSRSSNQKNSSTAKK